MTSLKELNMKKFNTDNVTNMSHIFFECSALKELIIDNFNTKKLTNINGMFSGCSSLQIKS